MICLLVSINILASQATDNSKHAKNITFEEGSNQNLCKRSSTHPIRLDGRYGAINNVCITKDYSILNGPNGIDSPNVGLVFQGHKVVNVDDKKKEITLDLLVVMIWKDQRINALFPPSSNSIRLPPLIPEMAPVIWSPIQTIALPNNRNLKYLRDPIKARFKLRTVESANEMYKNISFTGDFPIVLSLIDWSITISCPFEFRNFPFDENNCPFVMKFEDINISLGYPKHKFEGLKQNDTDGFMIEVTQMNPKTTSSVQGMYDTDVTLCINVHRQAPKYIYQYYIPCITMVIASSFSFIIPLSAIPGRVALIVTQFLTLTNVFINQMVSLNS